MDSWQEAVEGEEGVSACKALGEGSNNGSRGWGAGEGKGVDGSASREGRSVEGREVYCSSGRGRGLNVIHERGRLLSVCYRSLSCEVYFLLHNLNCLSCS